MPTRHDVSLGDHLSLLAAQAGFGNVQRILDHPDNQSIAKRDHPAIVDPGEVVVIPELEPGTFTAASGQKHKFVFHRLKTKLKIVFKTFRGGPTAATDATLVVGDAVPQPAPLSGGALEADTKPTDGSAQVNVSPPDNGQPELVWQLRLGHLGRPEREAGALARLRNMGYYRAVPDDADERERRSAVEEFQVDNAMKPTGTLDAATMDKIAEAYGC